jgi:hypothetical protein
MYPLIYYKGLLSKKFLNIFLDTFTMYYYIVKVEISRLLQYLVSF